MVRRVAEFGDTWIWVSVLLWAVALGVIHGMLAPTLDKATQRIEAEESVATLTARVIAVGAAVSLMFLAIVVLMVYQPGS